MPFTVGVNGTNVKNLLVTEYDVINNFTGHELWQWGSRAEGALGDNKTCVNKSTNCVASSPVQTIAGGTNWRNTAGYKALRLFSGYDL